MKNARKKSIPEERLNEKIRALKIQVQLLEDQLQAQNNSTNPKKSVEFLLSEFNQLCEFWRHNDTRLGSWINLYLTASAITVSGLAYISQQVTDIKAFLLLIMFVALALFITGLMLVDGIVRTARIKEEYTQGLNLIRRYFVDSDLTIKDYLILPIANNPREKIKSKVPKLLLIVVYIWNSLLLGFIAGSMLWLLTPQTNIKFVFGVGIIATISSLSFFSIVLLRKKSAG